MKENIKGYFSKIALRKNKVIKTYFSGNQKLMHKIYSQNDIKVVFEEEINALQLSKKIHSKSVITPRILSINKMSYQMERYEIISFYSYLIHNRKKDLENIFHEFGAYLARFHNLTIDSNYKATLHGDLVAHNIFFLSDGKILLLDPKGQYNTIYYDVARMSMNFMHFNPIYKFILTNRRMKKLNNSFLNGYIEKFKLQFNWNNYEHALQKWMTYEKQYLKKEPIYLTKKFIMNRFSNHYLRKMEVKNNNQWKYSQRYLSGSINGENYEKTISNRFENFIWEIEKIILKKAIKTFVKGPSSKKYLDFASGTGRIAEFLSPFFKDITCLDTSDKMLKVAKKRLPKAKFLLGNIAEDKNLLKGKKYDVITAFRLFLNLEDVHRVPILKGLNNCLSKDGLLIVNNHMNKYSFLGLQFYLRRKIFKQKDIINTASGFEFKRFLKKGGFKVVKVYRFTILPGRKDFIFLPEKVLLPMELFLSKIPLINLLGKDQIYVCKKII